MEERNLFEVISVSEQKPKGNSIELSAHEKTLYLEFLEEFEGKKDSDKLLLLMTNFKRMEKK
jgi:hypothetical protein